MDVKTLSGSAAAFFSAVTWVQPRYDRPLAPSSAPPQSCL